MAAPDGLSMSLEDIIKKSARPGGQQGPTGGRGGRGGSHGGPFSPNGGMRRVGNTQSSGVSKPGRSAFNQGRRQGQRQPSQQSGRGGGRLGGRGGGRAFNRTEKDFQQIRRKAQMCYIEEATGDVVVQYHNTIIVRISPEGDILLDSGGFHKRMTLASFNDVLAPVGIKVSAPEAGRLEDTQWLVSDGRSLFRFQDGMTLDSKGIHSATRGALVLQAFDNPSAAAATFASNAAAAQAGLLPMNTPGVPLGGSSRGFMQDRSIGQSGNQGARHYGRAVNNDRGRHRSAAASRGADGSFINKTTQEGSSHERRPPHARDAMDVDMVPSDIVSYQDEPRHQHQSGRQRSSGPEERYGLGRMRSQGWHGHADEDMAASSQQHRLYAQGRHM